MPSLESRDSSHVGWGGGRKVGNKKSRHLKLSPSSVGNYFGSHRRTNLWWVLYHWKTCLDHHCRNDSVRLCHTDGPRVYSENSEIFNQIWISWFIHVTLLDNYWAQISLLIRSGYWELYNLDIDWQIVGHGLAPTANVAVINSKNNVKTVISNLFLNNLGLDPQKRSTSEYPIWGVREVGWWDYCQGT